MISLKFELTGGFIKSAALFSATFRRRPTANAERQIEIGGRRRERSRVRCVFGHLPIGDGSSAFAVGTLRDVEKKRARRERRPVGAAQGRRPRGHRARADAGQPHISGFFFKNENIFGARRRRHTRDGRFESGGRRRKRSRAGPASLARSVRPADASLGVSPSACSEILKKTAPDAG